MGIIDEKWRAGRCRIEDGIYFGTDEFAALDGRPGSGYQVSKRKPVASLIEERPDYWCQFNELVDLSIEDGRLQVQAGETSWDGDGVIYLVDVQEQRLVWLIHLSGSEPFVEVRSDDTHIFAASSQYPVRYEWRIPINNPEGFTVQSFDVP